MPSAVNIMRLQGVDPRPDNTQTQLIQQLGNTIVGGMEKRKAEKEEKANAEMVSTYTSELLTPQQREQAIKAEQLNLAEEQQISQVKQEADKARTQQQEAATLQNMMQNPDSLEKLGFIYKHDPQMAQFVMNTLKTNDVMAKAQLAAEAQESRQFFNNVGALVETDGVEVAKEYVRSYAQDYFAQTGDREKAGQIISLAALDGDQFAQRAKVQGLLAGNVAEMPEAMTAYQEAQIQLNRDKLNYEKQQDASELQDRKTVTQDGVAYYVDTGEKVLPNVEKKGDTKQDDAAKTYKAFNLAADGLIDALGNTETGAIQGRLPAVTAKQQIAEGAVSTMAPVLKQIFRTAGEGTFTDKDQELLMKMVPTRTDEPEAAKVKMNSIKQIVAAKLGIDESLPPKVDIESLSDEDLFK